ncbi:MAG: penicillin-binding protein [Deltaproteobacteria bacterium]|nr:penicillin-binding protein [Deltaproteobacteria bacterium]
MSVRFGDPKQKRKEVLEKRIQLFLFALCFGFLIIFGRVFLMVVRDNHRLSTMATRQYKVAIQQATNRARILDRGGKELAISVPAWSLFADASMVKNPGKVAARLAPILQVSEKDLRKKLSRDSRFVWLSRRVDDAKMEKISKLSLEEEGVFSLKENMRFYPNGRLAGSLLGAVGTDGQGLSGIELGFDSYLMMNPESEVYLKDARGRVYFSSKPFEPMKGKGDVYLTIDKNIQFFAEQALQRAVEKHSAKSGVILLMNPKNGKILTAANFPMIDPGQFKKSRWPIWRHQGITDIYEPGSTFKVVAAAAALDSGLVSPERKFDCEEGAYQLPGGKVINDTHKHGVLSVTEIIKVSSNIGTYKIVRAIGREKFFNTIQAFGIGKKTGIDYPGEGEGMLRHAKKWRGIEEATIAFGQGVGVTPLQMLSIFAAIANRGELMKPYLVRSIVSQQGEVLYQAQEELLYKPISERTARLLTKILKTVVGEGGTAMTAAMEDYPVAGKTGTSQKVDPEKKRYVSGKYIASFVGFAPADNPQLVALVLLDEPEGQYYGGEVAAPVFKEVMHYALTTLGVPPDGEGAVLQAEQNTSKELLLDAGRGRLRRPATLIGGMNQEAAEGRVGVLGASPEQLTSFREGTGGSKIIESTLQLPDLKGLTMRAVLKELEGYPVSVDFRGRGVAFSQSPKPGSTLRAGGKVYVEFAPIF